MKFLTEPLNSKHNKKEFNCGNFMLDNYLHKQANQDMKRNLTACFVFADEDIKAIKGYYTLSNNSISQDKIPAEYQKKLPNSYQSLPTTLIGRLAVDKQYKGQGIGKLLLIDALRRSYDVSSVIGSYALVVDPIDKIATEFYAKYGFIELPDSGKMFLPMQTIRSLFG